MAASNVIHQLVKRFEDHKESYRSDRYNETQLQHTVKSMDWAIDKLVFELYDLSEEWITSEINFS